MFEHWMHALAQAAEHAFEGTAFGKLDKWVDKHKIVRARLGLSANYRPWTQPAVGEPPKLLGVRSATAREVLDLAWASRPKEGRTFPFFVDISQCATRATWGPTLGCQTRSTRIYDFEQDRVLNVMDMLLLQGLPSTSMAMCNSRETEAHLFAGEGMFIPCLASIVLGIYLCPSAPWWPPKAAASTGAAESTL